MPDPVRDREEILERLARIEEKLDRVNAEHENLSKRVDTLKVRTATAESAYSNLDKRVMLVEERERHSSVNWDRVAVFIMAIITALVNLVVAGILRP